VTQTKTPPGNPGRFTAVRVYTNGTAYELKVFWLVGGETWEILYNQYPGNFELARTYEAANAATLCQWSQ